MTNHTAATQWLLVGLASGQTHTAPTACYVTGSPERRPIGSKGAKQIRLLSKESEEGPFVGKECKYMRVLNIQVHIQEIDSHAHFTCWAKPCTWGHWLLRAKNYSASKWRMTTQSANRERPLCWGGLISIECLAIIVSQLVLVRHVCRSMAFFQPPLTQQGLGWNIDKAITHCSGSFEVLWTCSFLMPFV